MSVNGVRLLGELPNQFHTMRVRIPLAFGSCQNMPIFCSLPVTPNYGAF